MNILGLDEKGLKGWREMIHHLQSHEDVVKVFFWSV